MKPNRLQKLEAERKSIIESLQYIRDLIQYEKGGKIEMVHVEVIDILKGLGR